MAKNKKRNLENNGRVNVVESIRSLANDPLLSKSS